MISRRHKKNKETPDLDMTTFMNLMVVLVPFLLVSAVFSRVTVLELNMPSGAGGEADDDPKVTVEVVVRRNVLEIGDGEQVIARFPNLIEQEEPEEEEGEQELQLLAFNSEILETEKLYDLKSLREILMRIKESYPDKTDSILLMEPDVPYAYLVGVMDVMRSADVLRQSEDGEESEEPQMERVILFPDISLGDAPEVEAS